MGNELETWLALRKEYNLGNYEIKELAAYLKVTTRTIQRWLKEPEKVNRERLTQIGKYLDTKPIKWRP